LAKVGETPKRFGVWAVLRAAEARAIGLPRIGQAKRPELNIVDLAQEPQMGFAEGALTDIRIKGGRARVSGPWMGLTGPMGPLPTHLTEFAFYETRYAKSKPFGDWLNLIAGRMLQLFYRSWADSQPAASADRPREDKFSGYLSALSGATEGVADDALTFSAQARVHYAALFSGSRSAVAIEDAMTHLLGQNATLLEFQARWRDLEPADQSRFGGSYARLGRDVVLGRRVRSASDAFRVVIRAASFSDYKALLPTGVRFAVAADALDAFKPSHLEWDIALEIQDCDAPPARLDGRAQLGWTSWVKPRGKRTSATTIRGDAHLRRIRKFNQGTFS
jgi:type VI secretion system protein ImpH